MRHRLRAALLPVLYVGSFAYLLADAASPSDADIHARAQTLPPDTPYKEQFSDGTWYRYVLSGRVPA